MSVDFWQRGSIEVYQRGKGEVGGSLTLRVATLGSSCCTANSEAGTRADSSCATAPAEDNKGDEGGSGKLHFQWLGRW